MLRRSTTAILMAIGVMFVSVTANAQSGPAHTPAATYKNDIKSNTVPFVPAPELSDMPGTDWQAISHLPEIDDPAALKRAFVDILLPEIRRANARIRADRGALMAIVAKIDAGKPIALQDIDVLMDLGARYKTQPFDLDELSLRVDEVPEAIALAQAALESGWGTSDLAQESLAFFGQVRAMGGYAWFGTISDSVKSYMANINTHLAYADFRAARAAGNLDAFEIAGHLTRYSELGRKYVKKVRGVLKAFEASPDIQVATR